MASATRLETALYGAAFHAAVGGALVAIAAWNRAAIPARFWAIALPCAVVMGGLVYLLAVAPYVMRRVYRKGSVFFDSAVGMFAELAVVAFTAAAFGVIDAVTAAEGVTAASVGNHVLFVFLYAVGNFLTQILVIGNLAGLIGWVLLKRRAPKPEAA
jgi:hypothetical protein